VDRVLEKVGDPLDPVAPRPLLQMDYVHQT